MNRHAIVCLALLTTLCLLPPPRLAGASSSVLVSYQGRVKSGGSDFSGTGRFKFALVTGTSLNRQATATATVTAGFLIGITIVDGGSGYVTAPVITITDASGSGATATATVTGGAVTAITVSSAGNGYSASPTVTVAPPPPSVTYATHWSNDGTSTAGSEPSASVGVPVTSGLFSVALGDTRLPGMSSLDGSLFTQPNLLLRIWFNDGVQGFAPLDPPQPLTAAPYAGVSLNASNLLGVVSATQLSGVIGSGNLAGAYSNPLNFNNPGNQYAGSGSGLTSLNASMLSSGTVPEARLPQGLARADQVWLLSGNSGTAPGAQYLGTSDKQPLEIKVGGVRVWRAEDNGDSSDINNLPDGAPNIIAGSASNVVSRDVVGATIAGGGATNYNGNAIPNTVRASWSTISGGVSNTIDYSASKSVIGGGNANEIARNASGSVIAGGEGQSINEGADHSVIAGGSENSIGTSAGHAAIVGGYTNYIGNSSPTAFLGGGSYNVVSSNSSSVVIGGGSQNRVGQSSSDAVISGGDQNVVGDNANHAMIPGGFGNYATNYAFAAGRRAKAWHSGSFVWGDSNNAEVGSTNRNSVTMRASGGYRLFTSTGGAGAYLAAGGGSWTSMSDRNAKEDFQPADTRAILDKVAELPLTTWRYKTQPSEVRHIGPTAQDFHAAFGVGESDTGITGVDADGVALAAIQALNSALKQKEVRIQTLERDLDEMKALVRSLAQRQERPH
jgi:hypothetical protein